MTGPLDHPALQGFDLENLQAHGETSEGRAFLAEKREALRGSRNKAAADHGDDHPLVKQVDEILQRFSLVLDQGGRA